MALEPFATNEVKSVRSGELRRVLGVSVEDHSFSQSKLLPPISREELKRFKVGAQETSSGARDRAKLSHESVLKLDKYCNIVSRKWIKNDLQSSEKGGGLNLLNIWSQMQQKTSYLLSQRLEEQTKNAVPKKRVRSSIAELRDSSTHSLELEGRNTVPIRQGAMMDKDRSVLSDKDKDMIMANNGDPISLEEKMRGPPTGGDGWEKNLKLKRSVGAMVARRADGEGEIKQAMQHDEICPQSSDSFGFRTGSSNVNVGSNRMDGSSQLSGRSCIVPRNDLDNGFLSEERRECTVGSDNERAIMKGTNKLTIRKDGQSPLTKGKASRTQRPGSAVMMNTPNLLGSSGSIDGREQLSSLDQFQHLPEVNHKRPLPTGSSSPPVQWASQRPLKISRSRRTNVVSPVSNIDEDHDLSEGFSVPDVGARLTSTETCGDLLSRGMANSTHQIKLKIGNVPSPAGLCESEGSGVPESKLKEKDIDNVGIEDGTLSAGPKIAICVLPTKKNRLPPKEDIGGVQRQGRSGRGSIQSKACLPVTKEKLENVESTRPLKSGKPVSDMTESRVGRPLSKKVSDRKGYTRTREKRNSGSSDLDVEPEDDRKELLAAVNAARAARSVASSRAFWNQMESIFACVTSEDLAYLKHQITFAEELDGSLCDLLDTNQSGMGEITCQKMPSSEICQQASQENVVGLNKPVETLSSVNESHVLKMTPGELARERCFEKIIPLSQRLLSAFITEDERKMFDSGVKQGDAVLQFTSDSSPPAGENSHAQNKLNPGFDVDHDLKNQTNCFGENIPCNGCALPNSFTSPNNFISCDKALQENDVIIHHDAGYVLHSGQSKTTWEESMAIDSYGTPYDCQFEHMPLDDRILMELHSIGIFPNTSPGRSEGDAEEIGKVISELNIKLYQEVRNKKNQLIKLEKAVREGMDYERRNLEQLAMDKLVEMAYKRLMGRRGGSSYKNGGSKVSKQLALAFAKRTLSRCRTFEKTGQSCFSEPVLQDSLFSEPSHSSNSKYSDGIKFGSSANMRVGSRNCPLTLQVSASGAMASGMSSKRTKRHVPSHKIDKDPLDPIQEAAEQILAKIDSVSNIGKKGEELLNEVVRSAALRAIPTPNSTLLGGAKWKRTDKDALPRNSVQRAGLPSLSAGRGRRRTKAKQNQKIAQLSTYGNDVARMIETTSPVLPSMIEYRETINSGNTKVKQEAELLSSHNLSQDLSKDREDMLLQGINSIDELDVTVGLGGQGQDISSWLNVDEEALQDQDLICLQIPMDDLTDLKLDF